MYRICSIVGSGGGGGSVGTAGAGGWAGTATGGTESRFVTVSCCNVTAVISITNPTSITDSSSNS